MNRVGPRSCDAAVGGCDRMRLLQQVVLDAGATPAN
jgi:hypothetical protein